MPLLDTSNLNFFHPPRNVPLSVFESPSSPIVAARVCFECWDQVNGVQSPRTPELLSSSPVPFARHLDSSNSSIISTPPDRISHLTRPIIRRSETLPEFPQIPPQSPLLPADEDLGELAAYPLRYSSALCKKMGGGRWCPKQVTVIEGHRIPGCKAQYEIDMEREEEERRRFKMNPVFKDGGTCFITIMRLSSTDIDLIIRIPIPCASRNRTTVFTWCWPFCAFHFLICLLSILLRFIPVFFIIPYYRDTVWLPLLDLYSPFLVLGYNGLVSYVYHHVENTILPLLSYCIYIHVPVCCLRSGSLRIKFFLT
jgi:hypothetical protein